MTIEKPWVVTGLTAAGVASWFGIAEVNDLFGEHPLHTHFAYRSIERTALTLALVTSMSGFFMGAVKTGFPRKETAE